MRDQMLPIGLQLAMWSILALAANTVAAPGTIGQVGELMLANLRGCWFPRVCQ